MKNPPPLKIMVVDDHPAFRMGLKKLVQSNPRLHVVAECGDGREAVALYRQLRPDIVLMDLRLPGLGGAEATMAIRTEFPDARVIVLTTFDADEDIHRAMQAGAKSYLLKDSAKEDIMDTILSVQAGEPKLPPGIAHRLAAREQRAELTAREHDVLHQLGKGRSNSEIAADLNISEDTVKSHIKAVFLKLGVNDRTAAVISAIRHGIIHVD